MTKKKDVSQRPTLHLILVEDDPKFINIYETFFNRVLKNTLLVKANQIDFMLHKCRSFEGFQELGKMLVATGHPVYATLDLKITRRKKDDTPTDCSKELIDLCFRFKKNRQYCSPFEFCLISGSDNILKKLIDDPRINDNLKHWGVNHIFKKDIPPQTENEYKLGKVAEDIKAFMLKNISYCSFPETTTFQKSPCPRLIWFGFDQTRLLTQAEQIARNPEGLYLIFSEAAGYEEDWFRLCCFLAQKRPTIRALDRCRPSDLWTQEIEDPPEALLISGIEEVQQNNLDLKAALETYNFFHNATAKKCLVFFLFPWGQTELSLTNRLEENELEVLKLCLKMVYGYENPTGTGIDFPYPPHPNVIPFPSYEDLRRSRTFERTIEVLTSKCQEMRPDELKNVELDPELLGVLIDLPWERLGGFDKLQNAVTTAFDAYREREGLITIDHIKDEKIRPEYHSSFGFLVRGQMLYGLLEKNDSNSKSWARGVDRKPVDPTSPLGGLSVVLDLYKRLGALVKLGKELEKQEGALPANEYFPSTYYQALADCYNFLDLIFKGEERLDFQISQFKPHAEDNNWQSVYPGIREREDFADLVDKIKVKWPFDHLPLHFSIYHYLERSGVIMEIHTDVETVLQHHDDLRLEWEKVEEQRRSIQEKLQTREEQHRSAKRHILAGSRQPFSTYLKDENEGKNLDFNYPLRAFLFFNAHVAICENLYLFKSKLLSPGVVRAMLEKAQLGHSIALLCQYVSRIQEKGNESGLKRSIFSKWVDSWPIDGGQDDFLRLIRELIQKIEAVYPDTFKADNRKILQSLGELEKDCKISDILNFFNILRLRFAKNPVPDFWMQFGEKIWDIMRRFHSATEKENLRFGIVSKCGSTAELWSWNNFESCELKGGSPENRDRLCVFIGKNPVPLYPIDDLIRVNKETASVWSYYNGGIWANLTYLPNSPTEKHEVFPQNDPHLPNFEVFKQSKIWRSINETN